LYGRRMRRLYCVLRLGSAILPEWMARKQEASCELGTHSGKNGFSHRGGVTRQDAFFGRSGRGDACVARTRGVGGKEVVRVM